jgi:hypothetical protein
LCAILSEEVWSKLYRILISFSFELAQSSESPSREIKDCLSMFCLKQLKFTVRYSTDFVSQLVKPDSYAVKRNANRHKLNAETNTTDF